MDKNGCILKVLVIFGCELGFVYNKSDYYSLSDACAVSLLSH